MDIFIHEVDNRSVFDAYLDGKLLCRRSRSPLFTSARILQAQGVHDDMPLRMWHEGSTAPSIESTVGAMAALRAKEESFGAPRLAKFEIGAPWSDVAATGPSK